LIKLVRRDKHR